MVCAAHTAITMNVESGTFHKAMPVGRCREEQCAKPDSRISQQDGHAESSKLGYHINGAYRDILAIKEAEQRQ